MKKKLFYLLPFLIAVLISCKNSTEPIPLKESPPGFQENVPWPSLADSPWPMFRGNPQLTGHSQLQGNGSFSSTTLFTIPFEINSGHNLTSVSISPDSNLYFGSSFEKDSLSNWVSFLYSISNAGILNWKFKFNVDQITTTPLISKDGTIYVGSYDKYFYAINPNGTLKWKYFVNSGIVSSLINIDKVGNLYFVDNDGTLWSISEIGNKNWNLSVDGGFDFTSMSGFSFSTDGKTLYVPGIKILGSKTLYAVSTEGSITWSFDNGGSVIAAPIVESNGNIIFQFNKSTNAVISGIISINDSGDINWIDSSGVYFCTPTIDGFGNIYYCDESANGQLISVDYSGKFRWKLNKGFLNAGIISDTNNNLFFLVNNSFVSVNMNGTVTTSINFNQVSWTDASIGFNNNIYLQSVSPQKSILKLN